MTVDEIVELALRQAHIPSLVVALSFLSDRPDLLREDWTPRYQPYSDQHSGGLDEATLNELRDKLRPLVHQFATKTSAPPSRDLPTLMNFIAGTKIPERYLPLLEHELGLSAETTKQAPPLCSRRKVLIVGAGMSGLLAGVRLKQAGYDFQIIERSKEIGGTWSTNTYPGCRVDSPNHLYSYSLFPNHDWPHRYSRQHALKKYFENAVERFNLREHIALDTRLVSAEFDETRGRWVATTIKGADAPQKLEVDVVVSAVGQLNQPKIPSFAGQRDFLGPQFHSATWRHDVDLEGRKVAVIGTGASAFQLIPEVAKDAKSLTIFQRTAPWISPTPDYHSEVGEGQQWLLKNLPFYANWYRFWLFWTMTEGVMPALKIDPTWSATDGSISESNQNIRNVLIESMRAQLGDRTDLLEKIIPQSPFGGKRTLRDDGKWIATLKRPNVDLVTTKIVKITPSSIATADGTEYPADVIIYGTGFEASRFLQSAKIFGRGGLELNECWSGDPKAYLGMTVPAFPNFFCIFGPNTNLVAQGSIIFFSECSVDYIVQCLDMLENRNAATMEPKQDVHDTYNASVDAENSRMAWGMEGVTNWYKSDSGRVSQNWPFPLVDYWMCTRQPNPDDFVFSEFSEDTSGAKKETSGT
jgi:4-hydroxyacetophenone monooxygenase